MFQCLPPYQPLESSNLGLILLDQVSRLHIVIQRAGLKLADPDPDQLAGNVVSLGQRVQCLARDGFRSNLPLEHGAV